MAAPITNVNERRPMKVRFYSSITFLLFCAITMLFG